MLNLKSNTSKGVLLLVLSLVVLYIYFGGGGRKERTLKSELVSIDTAKVTQIVIMPKGNGETVKLLKKDNEWWVNLDGEKSASVPKEKVENLFATLLRVKPNRLVTRKKEKWGEYQVGEKATRVKVFENGNESLDIMLGKFSYQQPRQMNSFVRLANESDVYEVDGFLEMTFNKKRNSFRNNNILKDNESKWNSVSFNYPNNSFSLIKDNGVWEIDGVKTDSAETVKYLRSLARLTSSEYIDDIQNPKTVKRLTIERDDSTTYTISEVVADSILAVNSSINSKSYFDASKNGLSDKIFVDKTKFIK